MRPDSGTLHLDVGRFAEETKKGVVDWIKWLEANPSSKKARNAMKHLSSLVQVSSTSVWKAAPAGGGFALVIFAKTS
jgi:hypothetical protein